MDIQAIKDYIKQCDKIEMPDIQEHFQLNYSETVKVFAELEKQGIVKYCEGFMYTSTTQETGAKKSCQAYSPQSLQEEAFIEALWECVKENEVSIPFLLRKCSMSYYMASRTIDWMEKNGFVSAEYGLHSRNVLITREEFVEKFGNPDKGAEKQKESESVTRSHSDLIEYLSYSEDDDNDEDHDNDDEDDEDDYVETTQVEERREAFERRHQELLERLQLAKEENEKTLKAQHDKIAADIQSECKKMPDYNAEDSTFSIKVKVTYPDGTPFRIKIVENDGVWYLSDCGRTIGYLSGSNSREVLINYVKNVVVNDDICMIDDAICTTIDDIHDLTGESASLFKVVNGLITQENFDVPCLGEELVKLANDILAEEDSEMMINVLSEVEDKPIRLSRLQRALHVGYTGIIRIIMSLSDLGLIEVHGATVVRAEKCSQEFVLYLKRRFDNKTGK